MSKKYTTILSGGVVSTYADDSPDDDGSQTAANRVKYATITSDLTAPLHSAIVNMDTKIVAMLDNGPVEKTTAYTTVESDYNRMIEGNAVGLTITLLDPDGLGIGDDYRLYVKNTHASSDLTVDVDGGGTIDGSASITIQPNATSFFMVDSVGTGYNQIASLNAELLALAGLVSAANKVPRFTGSGTADMLDFLDEDNLASDNASAVASQQSIKAYADAVQTASQPVDADLTAIAGLTSAANKIPMFSGSGTATVIDLLDEDDMASDSATAVPTQQSVVAYIGSGTVFAPGTAMSFFQASAPTGWTQDATNNDRALRVVSGTGGGTGGTHGLTSAPATAHTHTGPSHTHTGPSHTHAGATHNHVWSNLEAPVSNTHDSAGNVVDFTGGSSSDGIAFATSGCLSNATHYTANATGTTGSGGTGNTGSGGTGNTGSSSPTAFAPLYVDVIICTKDA